MCSAAHRPLTLSLSVCTTFCPSRNIKATCFFPRSLIKNVYSITTTKIYNNKKIYIIFMKYVDTIVLFLLRLSTGYLHLISRPTIVMDSSHLWLWHVFTEICLLWTRESEWVSVFSMSSDKIPRFVCCCCFFATIFSFCIHIY